MNEDIEKTLRQCVAIVCEPENSAALGSCFAVTEDGVFVTCFHVIGNSTTGEVIHRIVKLAWPKLGIELRATVDPNASRPTADIAILKLIDEPMPKGVHVFTLDLRLFPNSEFVSFGYRKATAYKGLFARGIIIGEVADAEGRAFIQLNTNQIEQGMSGAPIVYQNYHRVVGIASSFWKSKELQDRDLAFAIPAREVVESLPRLSVTIPGMVAIPREDSTGRPKIADISSGRFELFHDVIRTAFIKAAILILADQFGDGSWARTLWRWSGGPFTKDVAPADIVAKTKIKKALSVTSWAGQAVFKATGNNRLRCLLRARSYIKSHWNAEAKAFGFLYDQQIGTPFIEGNTIFVGNPRHTASAAKFLEMTDGISSEVIDSVEFILSCESGEYGGWGERQGASPNSLSTAFILDALMKVSQAPGLSSCIAPQARSTLNPSIARGIAWLAQNQEIETGLWDYENHPILRPFYTAHVLAFAPQLVAAFPNEGERAIQALLSQKRDGGIPTHMSGEPHIAATSMLCYGLSKINPQKYERDIAELLEFAITKFLNEDYSSTYHIFDSIFVLMLTQLPFIHSKWWSIDVERAITQVEDIVANVSDWAEACAAIDTLSKESGIQNSAALAIISESPW
jgi:hypothetical protein